MATARIDALKLAGRSHNWLAHLEPVIWMAISAWMIIVFASSLSRWWLLLIGVLLWPIVDGVLRPSSRFFYPTTSRIKTHKPLVALTFDDGPDAEITPQVLDLLTLHHARASFFVIGKKLARQPELAQRMLAEGHLLANHSWAHARSQNFWGRQRLQDDIQRCTRLISAIQSTSTQHFYRAPMGLKSAPLGRAARHLGLHIIAWSLHSHDSRMSNPEHIAKRVLRRVKPGDIILFHDGHDLADHKRHHCVPALKLVLEGLQARGLKTVTVDTLLAEARLESKKVPH